VTRWTTADWLIKQLRKLGLDRRKGPLDSRSLAGLQVMYFEETVEDKLWNPTFIMEPPDRDLAAGARQRRRPEQ
jgi:lysyl-tRNA synthetase class II